MKKEKDKLKREENLLRKIIEESITEILLEDFEGDYSTPSNTLSGIGYQNMNSYGDYGGGGYGGSGGSARDVLSSIGSILPIGIVPRVAKTLMWGIEHMTMRVGRLLATVGVYLAKAFFPGFDAIADYKKIRQYEANQIANIDRKYAETLKENLAIFHNLDAWGIVFLLDPTLGLGWRLVENSPAAAISLANALTAGHASDLVRRGWEAASRDKEDHGTGRGGGRESFQDMLKSLGINEATGNSGDVNKFKEVLKKVFNSKEFKQEMMSAGVYQKVKSFAQNSILLRAKSVLGAKTLEELAKIPEISDSAQNAIKTIQAKGLENKLSEQEIQQMKDGLLFKLKQDFKALSIKNLQKDAASNPTVASSVSGIISQIQKM